MENSGAFSYDRSDAVGILVWESAMRLPCVSLSADGGRWMQMQLSIYSWNESSYRKGGRMLLVIQHPSEKLALWDTQSIASFSLLRARSETMDGSHLPCVHWKYLDSKLETDIWYPYTSFKTITLQNALICRLMKRWSSTTFNLESNSWTCRHIIRHSPNDSVSKGAQSLPFSALHNMTAYY